MISQNQPIDKGPFGLDLSLFVTPSRKHPWAVALAALALTLALGWYAATHFKINTDVNQLLSPDLAWRQQEKAMEEAFPDKVDRLLAVIDGDTAERAESAAAALAKALEAQPTLFRQVERPDSIPYFRKNGVLLLKEESLGGILDQIVQAQPLLGVATSDPTLRGFFGMLDLMGEGYLQGQTGLDRIDRPMAVTADTVEAALAGNDRPLALQSMMGDGKLSLRDTRKFVLSRPVLDYAALEPGRAASDALRAAAKSLNLTPDHGMTVRLTGSVALNDEEFASVSEGMGMATSLSGILVLVILFMALRSFRLIVPIAITLIVGLVATTAFALATVGSLNLISVAFAVMFIGIAVDFGIQFGVRYRDQRHKNPDHATAMDRTAKILSGPLSMAGFATALGFIAFIPTDYRGVSELGLIAGGGMLIALALNVTLLPALLTIAKPPAESEAIGYAWMAPVDRFMVSHRKTAGLAILVLACCGMAAMTQLRFDFDPLNLKNPRAESVATLFDLMQDPDFGVYTVSALRPSREEAQKLAEEMEKLPQVDHAITLNSFVPESQETKLAMIADTRQLLEPTLALTRLPEPTETQLFESLDKLRAKLRKVAEKAGTTGISALRLADALDQVAQKHDSAPIERVTRNIIGPMQEKMAMMKDVLSAQPVTLDSITEDLRKGWVTKDGRYLVEIYPKGNPRDYNTLVAFSDAVRRMAPDATGGPVSIRESGRTVSQAFLQAGCYALVVLALLTLVVLRNVRQTVLLMAALIFAGVITLATTVAIGLPLNYANIISLPLLLSLGVSYAIYFIYSWRSGERAPLQTSMARAVLFSAATTLTAFGSLALSSHLGTAGMGELLTMALLYCLASTFFILPVLLGIFNNDTT
ncbi:MAG: MMPL family transporter [Bdellovibrionales bacterium]